jgi:hypothetical protein
VRASRWGPGRQILREPIQGGSQDFFLISQACAVIGKLGTAAAALTRLWPARIENQARHALLFRLSSLR